MESPNQEEENKAEALHLSLIEKIETLQDMILKAHPTLPNLLRQIHTILKENASIVTLLTEEQIGVIVTGLKKQTKTELISSALKKTPAKALKHTTVDML
jgi:hypothetical protein